jgi:hypothetical protein
VNAIRPSHWPTVLFSRNQSADSVLRYEFIQTDWDIFSIVASLSSDLPAVLALNFMIMSEASLLTKCLLRIDDDRDTSELLTVF